MKEIALVTGANGFIGKAMVKKLLSEGDEVFALVTDEAPLLELSCDKLHIIKVFFEDYSLLFEKINHDIDIVYHFAWVGLCGDAVKDYAMQLKNAEYSATLLDQAIKLHAKKYVFASSMNVLEVIKYLNEKSVKPRYTVIYATAKLAAEMICKTIAYNQGIEFNCGLIAMAFGENNYAKMVPNVVISRLLNGKKPKLIEGKNLYDMIYVDDIAEAFFAIGKKGANQKTYYVGHENLKTFRDLILEIRDVVAPTLDLVFGEIIESNAFDYSQVDLHELERDTGFKAKADFKKSIAKTAKWIKENNLNFD